MSENENLENKSKAELIAIINKLNKQANVLISTRDTQFEYARRLQRENESLRETLSRKY